MTGTPRSACRAITSKTIRGQLGDNYFNLAGGNDTIIAGDGNDTIDMSTGGPSSPGNDGVAAGRASISGLRRLR